MAGTPENYEYAYDGNDGTYFRCTGQVVVRYHTWEAQTFSYATVLLSVISSVTASADATAWTISYSYDAGVTWNTLVTGTGVSAFDTDTLLLDTSKALSDLQVKVDCPAGKTIRVYDIQITGCYPSEDTWTLVDAPSTTYSLVGKPSTSWSTVSKPSTTYTLVDKPS